MSFYENKVLPLLINSACSTRQVMKIRRQVVPRATGDVLEVGMGSGLNLEFYDREKVNMVWGLEPSEGMRLKARANLNASPVEVKWLDLPGEQIPLEDESIDTVLLTYTLCTIPDWQAALKQMHRVLMPTGKLLFAEHGRAPETDIRKWQDRITPIWKKIGGGCHLNRPISDYLVEGGFRIETLDTFYMKKTPRIVGHMYVGEAVKA
ncbi:class I SAM-dependent methyltransferase [Proteobacteria bacterium 005FR1]|nr:class I SAM-dependent methyltransferase [Proteobacteria bacterium 005FR1]